MTDNMGIERQVTLALLNRNIIRIKGIVDAEMVDDALVYLDLFECNGSPPIEIRFQTRGGSLLDGMHLYDAFRIYKGKTTGVIYTNALSMGAILLQACDVRVALPNSFVLIHNAIFSGLSIDVLQNPRRLKKEYADTLVIQERIYADIARRTGKSIEEIRKICLKDEKMSAQKALEIGLIDRIKEGKGSG